ncbi:hypothetical protein V2G26_009738 [Clonostachys chloroleuca]
MSEALAQLALLPHSQVLSLARVLLHACFRSLSFPNNEPDHTQLILLPKRLPVSSSSFTSAHSRCITTKPSPYPIFHDPVALLPLLSGSPTSQSHSGSGLQ